MVHQKMTQREIAKINRMLILNSIREKGVATKYDISSTLKLSHTTVNTYVAQLMREGLVKEAGYGASEGEGRSWWKLPKQQDIFLVWSLLPIE